MRFLLLSMWLVLTCAAAHAAGARDTVARARTAIENGTVDPTRDLGPVVAALARARGDTLGDLISAVEEIGRHDGASPAAVKQYLQQHAPPVLLEVARGRGDWVVRSRALMALRTLNASDEFMDDAIAVAEADTSKQAGFFRSQAESLRSWKASRDRFGPAAGVPRPSDPARERRALEFLRQRGLGVSERQLQSSVREGDVEAVEALLDAGVSASAGSVLSALDAVGAGCATATGTADGHVRAIHLLVEHGADVNARDPLDNTPLLGIAMHCPLAVVRALVESGARIDAVNKQGVSPLSMALLGNHWDVAEYLVGRGARLSKSAIDEVFFERPSDPEKRALLRRATIQ